jgi:hypothetical protein
LFEDQGAGADEVALGDVWVVSGASDLVAGGDGDRVDGWVGELFAEVLDDRCADAGRVEGEVDTVAERWFVGAGGERGGEFRVGVPSGKR